MLRSLHQHLATRGRMRPISDGAESDHARDLGGVVAVLARQDWAQQLLTAAVANTNGTWVSVEWII